VVATKVKSFIKNNAPTESAPVVVEETETVICTMDAMMCPDGSYVGRSGPKCEFKCPEMEATTTITYTPRLNEIFDINGVQMNVWAVTEDSRCPSDVTCIQAGRATIGLNIGSVTAELEIGQTIEVGGFSITLVDVLPYPISTYKTQDNEYLFTLKFTPIQY
jgi:hypothetical protein